MDDSSLDFYIVNNLTTLKLLVSFDISEKGLTGEIPGRLLSLILPIEDGGSGLSYDLSGNYLELPSTSLDLLPHITNLRLPDKGLIGILSPDIFHLKLLVIIDLSDNSLMGHIPSQLGMIEPLQKLILRYEKNLSNNSVLSMHHSTYIYRHFISF
jgi:hypothetical protein